MKRIRKLDSLLADKIAAGEVVERPASIVKELVENAIDAFASVIRVEADEGGISLVRVMDDGLGIVREDRETAFERHATSKIQSDRDLFRIRSLGFRGEALPSIASVSELQMTTTAAGEDGETLLYRDGILMERKPAAPRRGTDISVQKLFHRTPARLKHLKSVLTEAGHISDVINRMALAHPEIRFDLYHNGKKQFSSPGDGRLLNVMRHVYGPRTAAAMKEFHAQNADFEIRGCAALPEHARAGRSYMTVIMNGRFVKSPIVTRAILDGYQSLLPIGRYPIICIHITLNPSLIDVNVHPSKLEVRLSKEPELSTFIKEEIRKLWSEARLIPEMKQKPATQTKPETEAIPLSFYPEESGKSNVVQEHGMKPETPMKETPPDRKADKTIPIPDSSAPVHDAEKETTQRSGEISEERHYSDAAVPYLEIVGQLHGTYIVCQNETGMYMIDQHAAQERINYEYYLKKLATPSRDLKTLLVPITIDLSASDAAAVQEYQEELETSGVFLESFGGNSFLVRSCPSWFPEGGEEKAVYELINYVTKSGKIDLSILRNDAAALLACKASIKANHSLPLSHMQGLIEQWRNCDNPYTCPHGRPVMIHFSTYEIEKMFKRVMN
ncbi:DNA mismatch repair endonuclease MutL [Alkalicoccus luteus]|uniref:DNA mismatch repair protein MutL n=1 Tax=Alkalicoccus luteus TaxID=1237094 RepID=A0A969TVE5_9BACI|nr:DNA mismatch repair endonuclease MutL [Alkalicoccus luteus]NJP36279.1 DNA mismatch repair endonuclease MutL [Alkalicoccus luteus]